MPFSSPQYKLIREAWANVRWRGKTIDMVAYETGVKPEVVKRAKKICCGELSHRGRLPKLDLTKVNWSLPDTVIAKSHGVTPYTVEKARAIMRKPAANRKSSFKPERYSHIDWAMRDTEIAKLEGVTRSRIGQIRKRMNIKSLGRPSPAIKWLKDHKDECKNTTAKQAAEMAGVTLHSIYEAAVRLKVKFATPPRSKKSFWHLINWDLPNVDISTIWRVKDPPSANRAGIRVGLTRYQHKKGPPKWDRRFGKVITDPEYQKALNEEVKAACDWHWNHPKKGK